MHAPMTGRAVGVITEWHWLAVAQAVIHSPQKLTQSTRAGFSQNWVECMLHQSGFKCHIPRLVHGVLKNDMTWWRNFVNLSYMSVHPSTHPMALQPKLGLGLHLRFRDKKVLQCEVLASRLIPVKFAGPMIFCWGLFP
jgi:hypothetical protein